MKYSRKHLLLPGLMLALLPLAAAPVHAQDNIRSCASIGNAQERLACYDRAAQNADNLPVVRLPRNTRPAPEDSQPGNTESSTAVSRDDFGLELKQDSGGDREDTRTYTVLAARHNDFTGWTIEFDGGGTWKQVGTDDYDIKVGERYTIRRGTFNSFMLSNSNNNRKIRITRVE